MPCLFFMKTFRKNIYVLLFCLAVLSGCSKKIWITQYPRFYESSLKTIAVVPFRNHTSSRQAGNVISDRLADALRSNGTYRVFNRNDLKTLMDEQDLQVAFGGDAEQAAEKFRKFTDVQAILTGAITTYSATSNRQKKKDPQYAYDRRGNMYLAGYREYVHTRNEANVATTAVLIRVSDGVTIHAMASPASYTAWAEGSPPRMDPFACLNSATYNVVGRLLVEFAVVRRQIEIDPGKAFRIARELYDNKWTMVDKFKTTDEKMFVVLKLPACCDRNRFRLTIIRKNQREDLAARGIVWSPADPKVGRGYEFSPRQIAEAGGGPGQYVVKFYSGPEPVMTREFWIVN